MLRYPTAASLRPGLANLAKLHFPLVKPLANLGLPALRPGAGVIPRGGGGVCETRRVQGDQGAYRPCGEHVELGLLPATGGRNCDVTDPLADGLALLLLLLDLPPWHHIMSPPCKGQGPGRLFARWKVPLVLVVAAPPSAPPSRAGPNLSDR